jgi:hypothetical protein
VAAISFDAGSISADLVLDKSDFIRGLADARAEAGKGVKVPVTFDISNASIAGAITKAKASFKSASAAIPVTFSVSAASIAAVLKDAKGAFRSASATMPLQFSVSTAAVTAGAAAARAAFKASGQSVSMPITFSVTSAAVAAGAVAARTAFKASGQAVSMPVNLTVNAGSLAAATAAQKALAAATNTTAAAGTRFGGVFGFLGTKVSLFAGALDNVLPPALKQVAVWHILADAVVEFGAVTIPATIAVTAWGIAASDAINNVVRQVTAYHTVSDAFQQSLPIFGKATGALEALHKAVEPQVYQLFGDALTIANSKTGEFSKLVMGTGTVLDQLGARFTVAVTSGNGFSTFMRNAIPDVARIGDSLGNLGGVFGTLFKAVPGYANVLLNLFDTFTRIAETAVRIAEPVIAAGLALHGFILYTGLAVTAAVALYGALGKLAVSFGLDVIGAYVAEVGTMILVNGVGTASVMVLSDAMALLAANPVVWISALVIGIGALAYLMVTATTATARWNASLQKLVLAAPVVSALNTLITEQSRSADALTAANQKLANTQEYVSTTNLHTGQTASGVNAAYTAQKDVVAQLTSGYVQLSDEASLWNYRLGKLGDTYHGTAAATGLLNLAGVTTKQMLTDNGEAWAIVQQQVAGVVKGYASMGVQSGTLGNDLQVINNQATDQYKAMQNLNTGIATFITNVTGTQTSFDTLALGGITLAANLTAANAASQTTKHTLDGLTVSSTLAGAAIDGTSQASLTLNQAFATQVGNVNTLAASWRTAGIASNLQTEGMKAAVGQLLKYAVGSQEARDQLAALAETAGFNLAPTMKNLTAWVGNTSGATKTLKDITNQATQQEALLTGAMQGQGNYIVNSLLNDLSAAELKYGGVAAATTAWGKAIAQSGAASTQAQSARTALINDLITTGQHANDSAQQIAALITKVTGIPKSEALAIVMTGTGKYAISGAGASATGGAGGGQRTAAAGLLVTGGIPGRDSVLVNTMPGELIVPTGLVNAGAVDHLRGRIPGFAAGGLVPGVSGAGNLNVLTGQQAVTDYGAFKMSMQNAMVAAMRTAILAAAKAAASIVGVSGPGGGAPAANAALAKQMMPAWASGAEWAAWNAVAMMESGWNAHAANPTSSARGIAQNISGWGPGYQEDNPASQISWMISYIRSRYGDPIGALAHENAYHWYASGTQGAAPGWGVVGERGAELVKFHGGETVMPHAASMAALGLPGYASGTGSATTLAAQVKLLRLEASLAGKEGSESRVTALITKHLAAEKAAHTPKERALYAGEVATERRELALWRSQAAALSKQIAALGGGAAVTAAGKVPAAVAAVHFGALAEAGKDLMASPAGRAKHAQTLNSLMAGASKAVTDDKLLEAVPGIGAAEKRQLAARQVASTRLLNFWTTESSELMAYRTQLANSNATLRKDVVAAQDMKLGAEAVTLGKQLAGQVSTVRAINTWLGPTAAQAAASAAAAAAATAATAATAPAGPSGQDLITAWLTAQGWVVGGTITPPTAKAMQWFDTGGRLPTGVSMVGNQTGGSERILSHGEEDALSRLAGGGGSKVEALLGQVVRLLGDAPGKTAAGVGDAINGAARGAVRRGAYTTR